PGRWIIVDREFRPVSDEGARVFHPLVRGITLERAQPTDKAGVSGGPRLDCRCVQAVPSLSHDGRLEGRSAMPAADLSQRHAAIAIVTECFGGSVDFGGGLINDLADPSAFDRCGLDPARPLEVLRPTLVAGPDECLHEFKGPDPFPCRHES